MQRSQSPPAVLYTTTNAQKSTIDDKIRQNQLEVEELKITMKDNIGKVYDRGLKLEDLEQSANYLENQANMFQVSAKQIKKSALCKNRKWTLIIILIVIIVLIIIGLSIGLSIGLKNTNNTPK